MILRNDRDEALECSHCHQVIELRKKTMQNPETLMLLVEQMREEHKPCEEFAEDPGRARAERVYREGMRDEMRRRR